MTVDRGVNHPRTKDEGTALHYGHSAVVGLLLLKTLENTYGETALKTAHEAKQKYLKGAFKVPKMPNFADESEMMAFDLGVWGEVIRGPPTLTGRAGIRLFSCSTTMPHLLC